MSELPAAWYDAASPPRLQYRRQPVVAARDALRRGIPQAAEEAVCEWAVYLATSKTEIAGTRLRW